MGEGSKVKKNEDGSQISCQLCLSCKHNQTVVVCTGDC